MGWKVSLIIIENEKNFANEFALLKAIGKPKYRFDREWRLVDCISPDDKSISIGYYNGNLIISDGYQITNNSLEGKDFLNLTREENELVSLFPNSEIITIACHSAINYHAYSLISKSVKRRLKIATPNEFIEYGERFEEENAIYSKANFESNEVYWIDENYDEKLTEDQLMEEFTFKIAERRLGVLLEDADELLERTKFRKYVPSNQVQQTKNRQVKISKESLKWIKYGVILLLIMIWQILKRKI
ncbi:MAG: hypothetical protein AAGG68_16875 [Bacteroidota bacterium]